ncbi:MAG: hypothetical protein NW224_16485 [Leptolyngbyaceae cyanobacterium bins.302]|nr:hypothetical protein [Leptolyngbyaceae cyanobacterium bins.302]
MSNQPNSNPEGNRKPVRKAAQSQKPSRPQGGRTRKTVTYSPKQATHKLYMRQATVSFGLVCLGITTFCGLQAMSVVLLLQGRIDQAIATSAGGFASNMGTSHARQVNKEAQDRLAKATQSTQRKRKPPAKS